MKRYLLIIAAVVAFFTTASAQRAELTASYGGYSQMGALDRP